MRFAVRIAVSAVCCVVPVMVGQTNSIPSATNPGDAKQIPGAKESSKMPASAVGDASAGQVIPIPSPSSTDRASQIPSPDGTARAVPVPDGVVDPARSMDAFVSATEKDVVALAEAMPADKYTFAPKNSDFTSGLTPNYAGVRTFGQEVAHLAAGNFLYVSMATGVKPDMAKMKSTSEGVDKATAVASLKASFAAYHQAVGGLTPANSFQKAGRGPDDSMISVLSAGLAHARDHYGQLVEYGRMNGVTPPASAGRPAANPKK